MKIAVPKETRPGETRVAASPETVKKYVGLGFAVCVEGGAGDGAAIADSAYAEAGAEIASSPSALYSDADIVLKVQRPTDAELDLIPRGAILAAALSPYADPDSVANYAKAGVTAFAMEFMPRITRAQSMDILSSQSNLAGYKAVIDAAAEFGRAMPMMMTAAGTVAPAKTFVMGAGVAGLQAIATARRLGAIVSATDVRWAAKEQVESLGASFVTVDEDAMKAAETEGGYAKEMSDDFKQRQADLVAEHVKKQDIVILTALIPGRKAPTLLTEQMVAGMKPGSVVVDLAVEQGGNCPLSKPGEIVDANGVKIVGHVNVPGRLAGNASELYAKNLLNFLSPLVDKEAGQLQIDWADEIMKGVTLTRDGAVVHPAFAAAQAASPDEAAEMDAEEQAEADARETPAKE